MMEPADKAIEIAELVDEATEIVKPVDEAVETSVTGETFQGADSPESTAGSGPMGTCVT
jgi:hypothetical protein